VVDLLALLEAERREAIDLGEVVHRRYIRAAPSGLRPAGYWREAQGVSPTVLELEAGRVRRFDEKRRSLSEETAPV
jgi:hypothetical protein